MNDFLVSQRVRLVGDPKWHNYVDAKIGDQIEVQTQYKNTSTEDITHEHVAMRAVLPKNLRCVPGSSKIFTAEWKTGKAFDKDTIVESGIGIGTYARNANAYVRFTVEVVDENLTDGVTGLVNWVQASVDGVTLQDHASIRVYKNCAKPTATDQPREKPTGPDRAYGGSTADGQPEA